MITTFKQTRWNRGCSTITFISHSFNDWVILSFRIFKTLLIPNRKSWGAETLRECSSPSMCHMWRVMCQVSGVKCQVYFFLSFQGGGASRGRVCYQGGLPRLVFKDCVIPNKYCFVFLTNIKYTRGLLLLLLHLFILALLRLLLLCL